MYKSQSDGDLFFNHLGETFKMSTSRAIKQEILETLHPDVYVEPQRKRKVAGRAKTEFKVDVKSISKARTKKRRNAKEEDDSDVIVTESRTFAPRRPYQWKGRRVRAVVRPGVPVVFTPGQRSSVRRKRVYDEVYGDNDILDQYDARINEFAYGKRQRESLPEKVVTRVKRSYSDDEGDYGKRSKTQTLDSSNPTPSHVPVTGQQVLPMGDDYVAPGTARLLPTVQVMVPQTTDLTSDYEPKRKRPLASSRESADVKVEVKDVKPIAPNIDLHTVDVKVPLKRKREEDEVYQAAKKIKDEVENMDTTLVTYTSEQPETMTWDSGVEPAALFESRPTRPIARARTRKRTAAATSMDTSPLPSEPVIIRQAAPVDTSVPMEIVTPVTQPVPSTSSMSLANEMITRPSRAMPTPRSSTSAVVTAPSVRRVVTPRSTSSRGRTPRVTSTSRGIIPEVRYHPSIVMASAKAKPRTRTTRRRRTTRVKKNSAAGRMRPFFILPERNSRGQFLPMSRYHPSISMITRRA